MKLPPPQDVDVLHTVREISRRDGRFLLSVAVVLVAVSLGLRSSLIPQQEIWAFVAAPLLIALPALVGYLREVTAPTFEHLVPGLLGAFAVVAFAQIVTVGWEYDLMVVAYGACYVVAGQLDYRHLVDRQKPGHLVAQEGILALLVGGAFLAILLLQWPLPLRLAGFFLVAVAACYRSFRVFGHPMPVRRAILLSLIVGQLVTFFGWAMSVYVYYAAGMFAVLLFLLWYFNRGLIRHTVEESLNRWVAVEYAGFAVVIGYLFLTSFLPR
ncbi:MAG: hypothetical protein WAM30_06220 [Candidatus Dormiibacterota bacterium]